MKHRLIPILLVVMSGLLSCTKPEKNDNQDGPSVRIPENAFVLAEQAETAVIILNADTNAEVWKWEPVSGGIPEEHRAWFKNPSEVKPVYNGKCILMTASGGAVALIRVNDSKVLFYAKCGEFPNPHSAELLPDGNIVAVESRYGDVCVFVTDYEKVLGEPVKVATIPDAHNAVWDMKNNCLFMTGKSASGNVALYRFNYNGDRRNPDLTNKKEVCIFDNDRGGHDLFPVYGENGKLWLSAASGVYKVDVTDPDSPVCEKAFDRSAVKSVSNGPGGVVMLKPTEEWWAEGLVDAKGDPVFILPGTKFYKGRWWLDNTFSYPAVHEM